MTKLFRYLSNLTNDSCTCIKYKPSCKDLTGDFLHIKETITRFNGQEQFVNVWDPLE